ncbi:MAG: homocysteine S-methyltransferase family protein [Phreatobacter sp.]|uniref:homocysteine S-methyltransferase family protein n=1 Tax=Phreatobacter sp. TaxID=1966341 RepID=UPI001A63977A|nr:homocysteine S-methyltransferase family protein [Phreatobacter sp.]MBL8571505.1 homocysteine S-methyltransferase family protein [Phreatobacter sp.]
MAKYRIHMPQLHGKTLVADGGLETTLIFRDGVDLPHFAAFVLVASEEGRRRLKAYFRRHLKIAQARGAGFVLDTPTWRANPDWGDKLGYDRAGLKRINEDSVGLALELREEYETADTPCVISGAIGPRGDGYKAGRMEAGEAEDYHRAQIADFAGTQADMVTAYTLNTVNEALGITRAAHSARMPAAIAFTVETDGRLPDGTTLGAAIDAVDQATGAYPAYYLINCAHPTHFERALDPKAAWFQRIGGIRANASTRSHAELDEATELDAGDPADLGRRYSELARLMPNVHVLGGCCGTDERHIAAICEAVLPAS